MNLTQLNILKPHNFSEIFSTRWPPNVTNPFPHPQTLGNRARKPKKMVFQLDSNTTGRRGWGRRDVTARGAGRGAALGSLCSTAAPRGRARCSRGECYTRNDNVVRESQREALPSLQHPTACQNKVRRSSVNWRQNQCYSKCCASAAGGFLLYVEAVKKRWR